MGTIESIESEKSKLNRYFHDKYFPIFHIDEFTGEDAYCFRSGNFLTDTRVDDVDFKGLTENETKNIRKSSARDNNFTAELKSLMSGIGTKIGEEYVGTPKYEILEDLIENDIKMAKEEATHLSRIESFLIGSSSKGKITYKIEVVFQNVSHQRLMSNFKFLIITPDNKRFGLGENDIVSITHQITSEGVWDIFSDTVILNVPIDVAERGVVNKSKISIRFDGLDIRTSLAFPFGSYPAKSFRLIKDDSLSDEEVDDLYDDYQEILELQEKESERLKREREEREAALEEEQKRKSFEDKLLSKVDAIGNLNLKDFNTLKKLLNTPFKIKEIQELDNFCKSNRIQSSVLEYIMCNVPLSLDRSKSFISQS